MNFPDFSQNLQQTALITQIRAIFFWDSKFILLPCRSDGQSSRERVLESQRIGLTRRQNSVANLMPI